MSDRKQRRQVTVGFEDALRTVDIELPPEEADPWDARTTLTHVGQPTARIDAHLKVSGRAQYTYDIRLPDMLHAAVLRCPLPAATLTRIDLEPARRMPGVVAVMAVAKAGDRLLFAGQDVAAVAATRLDQARDALRAIDVTYEGRPFVTDALRAADPRAPHVYDRAIKTRRTEGDEPGAEATVKQHGNIRELPPMVRGDIAAARRAATHIHKATYTTQVQTHAALETHGLVVRWDDEQHLTVWCSTQSIFSVRDELATVLGLPPAHIRVISEFVGGGFGAKFGASAPGSRLGTMAAELARLAQAPVKLMCSRHEEHVCTGNRPNSIQSIEIMSDAAGSLVGIDVSSHGTAGIGTGAGVGRNAFAIYSTCPNARISAHDVFTNAGPGAAMRAPGHPQGAFALELAIDELAAKAGLDPLGLRIAHDEHPVRRRQFEMGRDRFAWDDNRRASAAARDRNARLRRGYGVAASIWGDFGRGNAAIASCSVTPDGLIEIRNGVQDIGGGIGTVFALIGAEVFGQPLTAVRVRIGDSDLGPSVGSGGSQTTSSTTPAVRNACEQVKSKLLALAASHWDVPLSDVQWQRDSAVTAGDRTLAFKALCKLIDGEAVVATASRPNTYGGHPRIFLDGPMPQIAGVQFAEVTIDTWTGCVRAERILAIHDCGRVLNPLTTRGQVNGGVLLGTSYALFEERVMDHDLGRMLNPNLEQYKVLGARDAPKIDVELINVHTGANNTGAAGIGEPATIPTAAAIACAVYDALGVAVRSLPITPAKVLAALGRIPQETRPG